MRSGLTFELMQVLVIGKISQAAILAAAAYRNHETFKRQTGIANCRLIYDREHHDTKVDALRLQLLPCLWVLCSSLVALLRLP